MEIIIISGYRFNIVHVLTDSIRTIILVKLIIKHSVASLPGERITTGFVNCLNTLVYLNYSQ